ncbi:hypothetical protein HOLleu_24558 [Holothuria leucospilota]|uniref:Uncharacterized protein n=1 Tax=Holothuria leucospilota TaxID=206669 RepID=A0A9Q1BR81_HOLLE|nr:hypothetical protein HOLleu_24558 [Holothuria leucospilota]
MPAFFSNFLQKEPKIFGALRAPKFSFKHRFGTLFPSLRLWVAGPPVGELGPPVGEILAPPLANISAKSFTLVLKISAMIIT